MGAYYVYLWRNLTNGKCYVGKGRGSRALGHLRPSSKSLVAAAIRKHGRDAFTLTYLHTALTEDQAFALEISEIASRGTMAPQGYNRTLGGEGPSGQQISEEARARRAQAMTAERKQRLLDARNRNGVYARRLKLTEATYRNLMFVLHFSEAPDGVVGSWFGLSTFVVLKCRQGTYRAPWLSNWQDAKLLSAKKRPKGRKTMWLAQKRLQ